MFYKIVVLKDFAKLTGKYLYRIYTFLKKQPVYKQLARRWQIAKQLSGLNPISGRKPTISKFNCIKSNIGKILKSLILYIDFES